MAYIDPNTVISPKANWSLIKVLRNGEVHGNGDGDASLAIGKWDSYDGDGPQSVFALRWNGSKADATGVGNPQSRGLPTWFVVPSWLNEAIIQSGTIPEADKPFVTALLS
jgi:hypothetical protein